MGAMDKDLRYGDLPELFWDAQPDLPVDVTNPVALARLLTRGTPELLGRLLTLERLRAGFQHLDLPRHVMVFWQAVLDGAPPAGRK